MQAFFWILYAFHPHGRCDKAPRGYVLHDNLISVVILANLN